jgi:dTDP-4-amino-4,6-dideoxy-D-galactose acyltransferase
VNPPAPCEFLEWDTAFFGVRVGRVVGDRLTLDLSTQINQWCVDQGIECLYFLARSDDPDTSGLAEDQGFRLMDIRIALKTNRMDRTIEIEKSPVPGIGVRLALPGDIPFLEEIARQSHRDSRFYFDRRFPRRLCDDLYATWIRRSCEGYADSVFVAHQSDKPIGYVTCKMTLGAVGQIGLIGMQEGFRGLGVGKAMMNQAIGWFAAKGVSEVIVFTQGRNTVAQRFYQREAFLTTSVQLWYHKWFERHTAH